MDWFMENIVWPYAWPGGSVLILFVGVGVAKLYRAFKPVTHEQRKAKYEMLH